MRILLIRDAHMNATRVALHIVELRDQGIVFGLIHVSFN